MEFLGLAILALVALTLYFLPTVIARARKKRNLLGIFLLNLFLGWVFVGWVVALVWAVLADPPEPEGG